MCRSNGDFNFDSHRTAIQAKARTYFTDVNAAARSLFEDTTDNPWTTTYLFRNITVKDLPRLKTMYGKDWKVSETRADARTNKLHWAYGSMF